MVLNSIGSPKYNSWEARENSERAEKSEEGAKCDSRAVEEK